MTHLAPYHDLAIITAISLAIFALVCWAMRNQGGQL